jgi:predicted nucleic acid-binding protein
MSADYFLDTNVLVYSFDDSAPAKRDIAQGLIATALRQGCGVVSWQVVQEFLNVALHKWEEPMNAGDAGEYMSGTLEPLCAVFPSANLWRTALSLQAQSQYRFYDSLIVASALQSGSRILYSEDLQEGRRFGDLEILNPFVHTGGQPLGRRP